MNRHRNQIRNRRSDHSSEIKLSTTFSVSTRRKNLSHARNTELRALTNYHTGSLQPARNHRGRPRYSNSGVNGARVPLTLNITKWPVRYDGHFQADQKEV